MKKSLLAQLSLGISIIFYSGLALSHSDAKRTRYVAMNGADSSDCSSPFRPCNSIEYALKHATKGDNIKVAKGRYTLVGDSAHWYFSNNIITITGGYDAIDQFRIQAPHKHTTQLTGLPFHMRRSALAMGFQLITDGKSNHSVTQVVSRHMELSTRHNNNPCTDNLAGAYPCKNIDLVSHIPLPQDVAGSDIWGHTDLNDGVEYAIMGYTDGIRVYSLANPSAPSLVGHVTGAPTSWRDIKVYQYFDDVSNSFKAHAYISSESTHNQLQIIDLTLLPERLVELPAADIYQSAHNLFISNLDYGVNLPLSGNSPELQVTGANNFGGAVTRYDLQQATKPSLLHNPNDVTAYTHDNTQMTLTDQQAALACEGASRCEVLIDFNEKDVKLWDVSSTRLTRLLSTVNYTDVSENNKYVHSGWPSEDNQSLFVHDEFDEYRGNLATTIRVVSLTDPTSPVVAGIWTGNTNAIDHNGFSRGNDYFFSNYERGLTWLDISNPITPIEQGFFDTFPLSNNAVFNGAWGVYPFLPSGHVLISDINSGLYVVKPNRNGNANTASFSQQQLSTEENQTVTVTVSRTGDDLSPAHGFVESIDGSAKAGEDYQAINQKIQWQQGQQQASFELTTLASANTDKPKRLILRLRKLSSNLHVGEHRYLYVDIGSGQSSGSAYITIAEPEQSESAEAFIINVDRIGGSKGDLTVYYRINTTNSAQDISFDSGSISWTDGDTSSKQLMVNIINDDITEATESFSLVFSTSNDFTSTKSEHILTVLDDDDNSAPLVDTGQDISMPINSLLQFSSAIASDPDEGNSLSYQWQQTSGPALELSNIDTLTQLQVQSGTESGTANLVLTVTDNHGEATTDNLVITITPTTSNTNAPSNRGGGLMSLHLLTLLLLSLLKPYFQGNKWRYVICDWNCISSRNPFKSKRSKV